MAEILKEWLTERLQRPIKWEAQEFGDMMKNGHIVASLLYSYHAINDEKMFLIRPSNVAIDIKSNWKYLREWLREVEVFLTDQELNNITDGKGSAILRLFYQLFLHLDKKDRTDFIKRERKMVSNLVDKMDHRFVVEKVDETQEPPVNYLSKPLIEEKHFIEWQRKKTEEIKNMHDFIKHRYKKIIENIEDEKALSTYLDDEPREQTLPKAFKADKAGIERFSLQYPCDFEEYTYEELLRKEEESVKRRKSLVDSEWAENYMCDLYHRMHKRADAEEFQKQLRNILSNSLWAHSVGEAEDKLDADIAKKVMKLSQFEKQMCTQIMETKQQARNLTKNRIDAEKEYAEQRDLHFHQYLDNVKEQIHLEVVEIDFEKHRQETLHKKLYAEKMRRKRQHWYEICYETMLGIVDYATKYAYWTRLLENDIPDHFIHEWKNLFFRMQPVFEILDPIEDLLKEHGLEEEPAPEEEEIIRQELDRQDALNDADFLEYHNYSYPWTLDLLLPNYDPENEERKYEYLGNRILGHVVYTLLGKKYPYPTPRSPADLPVFRSRALIHGLPDKAITVPMQILLNKYMIHVVRVEAAVNFCLKKFKQEMVGCTEIELVYDKFIKAQPREEGKDFVKSLKAEDEQQSKSSDATSLLLWLEPIPPNCKQTQTPKVLPEVEIRLSPAAELGKNAYEALDFGDSLADEVLAAMLVEYIKYQDDIKGFVIINYPNNYRQAQILEEYFSGRAPPDEKELLEDRDEIYLEDTIAKHRKNEKDQFIDTRVSRLVNNPHKQIIETPFQSYFSCYLRMKETEDILQEHVIWNLNDENSELIDRFYAGLGINYTIYYEVIEKDLLALICEYIIGTQHVPLKIDEDLFGENVLQQLDFPTADDKRMKSKVLKPDVATSKSKDHFKHNHQPIIGNRMDVEVRTPDSTDSSPEERTVVEEVDEQCKVTDELPQLLAGEEDWDYAILPSSDIIGVALATFWEEIEKTYIRDMQQLFLAQRMQMNFLVPYCRFIKDKMEQIITMPSLKQDLVSNFQRSYNEFEDDWRDADVTKNEWHCRIKDLEAKLYIICEERKLYEGQQRTQLIMDNWTGEELTSMANNFISCLQTELNRSLLTFHILHDFYFASLKKMLTSDRISSKELTKINKEPEPNKEGKKGTTVIEDKIFKQLRQAFTDMHLKDVIMEYNNNPIFSLLDTNVKFAMKVVRDSCDYYRTLIAKEHNEIIRLNPKKKEETNPIKSKGSISSSTNSEEAFRDNAIKAVEEWIMAVNGEMFRASLRFLAIQYKCLHDMKLFNDCIYRAFTEIQDDINHYYMNEIKSVERLCKYMQMAVENGKKIPETLLLEHDIFVIDPNLLQFAPPAPPAEPSEINEVVNNMVEFKVSQLMRLLGQFKIVAPTGIALQQAFIYLLQDFIFFGKESCEGPLFPEVFKQIDPEKIPKFVFNLFGDTVYVDWRDFLIYCLNIRFPTLEELLSIRRNCKDFTTADLIKKEDFMKEELWFENDFDSTDKYSLLRKNLIKDFLYCLFETNDDKMNYSAMLLAFCKNPDPIEGFAMALSLAVGKKVCFCWETCEPVISGLIKWKQYREECLACARRCAAEIISAAIDRAVDYCTSSAHVDQTRSKFSKFDVKFKGKKGRKAESKTSSVRHIFDKKDTQSNMDTLKSESNVRLMTYICPPCAEPPAPEEQPIVREEVEEEQESEHPPDPSLAYAVPQRIIMNVLRTCLPWHYVLIPEMKVTPYKNELLDTFSKLEVNHDEGHIYVAQFVLERPINKTLHKVKKFTAYNLIEEVYKVCLN